MTTNAYAPAPTYTISGIGPYDAPFEYLDQSEVIVSVLVGDVLEKVDPADYSVIPEGPTTSGTVFLTTAYADAHEGETLVLARDTYIDQNWVGIGSTAAELETQLDEMARAIQENKVAGANSLRVINDALSPYEPQDGCVPYWDNTLGSFANGLNYSVLESGIAAATTANNRVDIAVHAMSGGKWKADVAELIADVDLTYTVDQNGTVEGGDKIVTQAEGFGYSVAPETATDHNLATAGGVKLYALEGSQGFNVRAYGAVGDGVSDDSAAIQAALNSVGANATLIIPSGTYKITSTPTIPLSTEQARLEIIAYGATFQIMGAIAGIARERPSDAGSAYTNAKIAVRGLTVQGDGTTGQHGFRFFTTYGMVLEDCHALSCDIGFLSVFGLMANVKTCLASHCSSFGFYFASGGSQIDFGSGAETALTGGTQNNSNSNGTVADQCRVFALAGSLAHFKAEACEMEFRNCIAEGHSADNCFEYDNLGSTTSKGITLKETHVECTPNNAVYKLHTSTGSIGGTYIIEGQDTVITTPGWTGALLDLGTIRPTCTIVMTSNKSIYNVTKVCKGANDNYHPTFILDTVDPNVWLNSANWDSGTVGVLVSAAPLRDSSNQFHEYLLRNYYFHTTYSEWQTSHFWKLIPGNDAIFDFSSAPSKKLRMEGFSGAGGLLLDGRFGMRDAEAGPYTTLGTLVGRAAIYDETNAFVGYAPLYDDIS